MMIYDGAKYKNQPWRALNRGLDLQMTNNLPRRRTTWQSLARLFAVFSEDKTCMIKTRF